jgi:hypothetical protein
MVCAVTRAMLTAIGPLRFKAFPGGSKGKGVRSGNFWYHKASEEK